MSNALQRQLISLQESQAVRDNSKILNITVDQVDRKYRVPIDLLKGISNASAGINSVSFEYCIFTDEHAKAIQDLDTNSVTFMNGSVSGSALVLMMPCLQKAEFLQFNHNINLGEEDTVEAMCSVLESEKLQTLAVDSNNNTSQENIDQLEEAYIARKTILQHFTIRTPRLRARSKSELDAERVRRAEVVAILEQKDLPPEIARKIVGSGLKLRL